MNAFRVTRENYVDTFRDLSTDSQATFYPENARELIKKLLETDKLALQCTPYAESPITAIFDVRGLKNISIKYKDSLHWSNE